MDASQKAWNTILGVVLAGFLAMLGETVETVTRRVVFGLSSVLPPRPLCFCLPFSCAIEGRIPDSLPFADVHREHLNSRDSQHPCAALRTARIHSHEANGSNRLETLSAPRTSLPSVVASGRSLSLLVSSLQGRFTTIPAPPLSSPLYRRRSDLHRKSATRALLSCPCHSSSPLRPLGLLALRPR